MLVKISANNILKYFSFLSKRIGFDISCKPSPDATICMTCQSLFSGKNNIGNMPSAESVQRGVKVKQEDHDGPISLT